VIRPGTGHPTDKATATTPVAHDAADVQRLAASSPSLDHLDARSSVCRACPRLVEWRETVATTKRASFAGQTYWGRPITGWGVGRPRIVVMGLAPAAHGGNRTGRIFTGDRSGDWLFAALHRAGLAEHAESVSADDGQQLHHTRVTLPVRCAPPANKPTEQERETCSPWLERELTWLLPTTRVIVTLGAFGWRSTFATLRRLDPSLPSRTPRFAHGAEAEAGHLTVLGCFHVSQQNTFTGKLTEPMLDAIFVRAREIAGLS
jgi:uracil-DNA glycosylase family 4